MASTASLPVALAATLAAALDRGIDTLSAEPGQAGCADIDAGARRRLLDFLALLLKWNRVYNLTAVRDPVAMVHRHLLDALTLLPYLPAPMPALVSVDAATSDTIPSDAIAPDDAWDLLDIGSGAGLPAIPLAIVRPDLAILSVDTNGKKTRFQQQVKLELDLAALTVRQARIETLADAEPPVRARCVTARAFTEPGAFLEIAARFCAPAGTALLMLGHSEAMAGLSPSGHAGFGAPEIHPVRVPGVDAARHIAICHRC